MSKDDSNSEDTWCKEPGPNSDIIRHWQKAQNPPPSWQEENREWMEEKE